jgi:hypothetical protein
VSLGFNVHTTQAAQFNNAIKTASQIVQTNTSAMVMNMGKLSVAAVGMFEAVGIAVAGMADKVASADQSYRLFGQRMFMDTMHAKQLKVALDALGQPLDAIAFDPELHRRFDELANLQNRLGGMLGPDFKQTMVQLRDAQFEFTRFRVEALYFRDLLVKQIFQALGGEKLTEKLRSWNEYIIQHIPEWSRIITTYIVPVLKDAWMIMKDLWTVTKDFAQLWTNMIGILSGDPALEGTISFEKFAAALSKVAHFMAVIIDFASHFAGTLAGAFLGFQIGGPMGALIGAGIGAGTDLIRSTYHTGSGGDQDTGAASLVAGTAMTGDSDINRMVGAVASVESGGHQINRSGGTLTSSAGALGIMQLMPTTAWQLGVNPNNAAENVRGGRMYLQQLYSKYGNWHDALGAYNMGPGNVDRALRAHRAFPSSVEGYISSVQGHYAKGDNPISIGQINIMQPNATPDQIVQAVSDGINKREQLASATHLNELKPAY